jgi:hypothetical protein
LPSVIVGIFFCGKVVPIQSFSILNTIEPESSILLPETDARFA